MLAKNLNDNAHYLVQRAVLEVFAGKPRSYIRPGTGPARGKRQSSIFGILRGAMKYIQVRAMKYIAGIRVNSTV